jgi:nucleotide-binding universal stress UspA family protein
MFRHILLPTDGSPTSSSAIKAGMAFAKESDARVTGLHVVPEFHVFTYVTEMLEGTQEEYEKQAAARGKKYLADIETAAREAQVNCNTLCVTSDHPYEAIIKAARDQQCDLIVMASHGTKGAKGLLLGSETQKVLTHCDIPVLVFR